MYATGYSCMPPITRCECKVMCRLCGSPRGGYVRWMSAPTSTERTAGLSVLLPFLEQDRACVDMFVDVAGSVKAVFSCLRLCTADKEDEQYSATLASDVVKQLSSSSRFIAGIFAQASLRRHFCSLSVGCRDLYCRPMPQLPLRCLGSVPCSAGWSLVGRRSWEHRGCGERGRKANRHLPGASSLRLQCLPVANAWLWCVGPSPCCDRCNL